MIRGIDVAYYEPVIDWSKVQAGGYKFAFIKCSQSNYNDSKFQEHWKNSKASGMPRGAYHFYDPRYYSPQAQAEKFFSSLGNDLGELPFVVDLELYTSGKYYGSRYWYDYLERLNQLSGNHATIIYTAPSYWNTNVYKTPSVIDVNYFGKYPLWIANYGVNSPVIPKPWTNWLFWQYEESDLIDGVYDTLGRKTECDVNLFNGTEQQFEDLLEPNTGEPMTDYVSLKANIDGEYRSIRQQVTYPRPPHITGQKIGQINVNNVAKALPTDFYIYTEDIMVNGETLAKKDDKWWKTYEANGNSIAGWIAEIHMGRRYLNTVLVVTTPPQVTHVIEIFVDGILEFRKEIL